MSTSAAAPRSDAPEITVFSVILAISFCHLLNDMMQSLLPAIYPNLKTELHLSFSQIGLVTLAYQITASILQPLVGFYADKRPTPNALPGGTLFSLAGLMILSAAHTYWLLLVGASMLGMGSSVFHPESSRVARMAAGGRHGLAQSLFQVGGNAGQALGPLAAALVVVRFGQSSLAFFALLALLSCAILWNVGQWYKNHGLALIVSGQKKSMAMPALPRKKALGGIAVLLAMIFSKYVYLASLTSYFTFYLIHRFGVSVETAQFHLFAFLAAVAVGTVVGGPLGDKFGRKYVIWFSILGALPFTLLLPHANLFWTGPLTVAIGLILASAFPAIVVFAQELVPGKIGMISGLFFGFSFGMGGLGAAVLGAVADRAGIETVYAICAYLPAIGLLAVLLPDPKKGN
ncbi:FSR family fosmidomycin resistance protein-like MFS transporter [Novosphingobium sp. PhB165]|uniref:MFS transporter n=1 Tax=Novosphingobium sp. PhB165 TaxID=2485105 RepID=UPI00104C984D|nr:MFS transporter [Novosphingobium sp. PhB165]TCM16113.1 FSR family fosmidomycin resistance protein-like MFS transporter [Novosphingobium sp. PhB165]